MLPVPTRFRTELPVRIASYNILAPAYVHPERYPFTDRGLLEWGARRDRLVARLVALNADVICLQEVERFVFQYLQASLEDRPDA